MSLLNDLRPLPPGHRVGGVEVRLQPIACPSRGKTQHARDFEETEYGHRLVCASCGFELLTINDPVILDAFRGHQR
jgi:hypothetical protein